MPNPVVEHIPDADQLSRHIDYPHKLNEHGDLLWQHIFLFSGDVESLVWRKYCPTIDEVHTLGCARAAHKRAEGKPIAYKGAITSVAERIRNLKSSKGHGFRVEHRPEDGQGEHHAEVELAYAPAAAVPKSERSELKRMIHSVWDPIQLHDCTIAPVDG